MMQKFIPSMHTIEDMQDYGLPTYAHDAQCDAEAQQLEVLPDAGGQSQLTHLPADSVPPLER